MIEKIKNLLEEYRKHVAEQKIQNRKLEEQLAELDWANIYHDTIRDKPWLQNLSLSPGRWAAGYPLLYLLTRILRDCRPTRILEFGLGESSKIISLYLQNELTQSNHLILENNALWQNHFEQNFTLGENSCIKVSPLESKTFNDQSYNSYKQIEEIEGKFDLYLVDGPRGTNRYSRFDIFLLAQRLEKEDEFIIIIDDFNRPGEKETYFELEILFKQKNIVVYVTEYTGKKSTAIFATSKYKWIASL